MSTKKANKRKSNNKVPRASTRRVSPVTDEDHDELDHHHYDDRNMSNLSVPGVMSKMLEASRKHREKRREELCEQHEKRVAKMRGQIAQRFDHFEAGRATIRTQQLSKLKELLERRKLVERDLAWTITNLTAEHQQCVLSLQAVLLRKTAELKQLTANG